MCMVGEGGLLAPWQQMDGIWQGVMEQMVGDRGNYQRNNTMRESEGGREGGREEGRVGRVGREGGREGREGRRREGRQEEQQVQRKRKLHVHEGFLCFLYTKQ